MKGGSLHMTIRSHSGLFCSHLQFSGTHTCGCLSLGCLKKKLEGGSHFPSQTSVKQLYFYSTKDWGVISKLSFAFGKTEQAILSSPFLCCFSKGPLLSFWFPLCQEGGWICTLSQSGSEKGPFSHFTPCSTVSSLKWEYPFSTQV